MKNIIGYYTCSCHPFTSREECDTEYKKILRPGQNVKNRCSGIEGVVYSIDAQKGFVVVKYGNNESDKHLEHVQGLIILN